tara:strand:+ start:512 stop:964 length:453 start_codon:yes stop_codon:yes gene_type:complete
MENLFISYDFSAKKEVENIHTTKENVLDIINKIKYVVCSGRDGQRLLYEDPSELTVVELFVTKSLLVAYNVECLGEFTITGIELLKKDTPKNKCLLKGVAEYSVYTIGEEGGEVCYGRHHFVESSFTVMRSSTGSIVLYLHCSDRCPVEY